MCGIVGYAGYLDKPSLSSALKAIHHRGPDDTGVKYFDSVAIGNTRLSIIDLSSKGNQPMFSSDKSLCIVFNGEIYNYSELKEKLKNKYKFNSGSDTEVVLYAYKEWGAKCLKEFDGMFSFVIYDIKKDLLFGARDRLGQKPLKYYFKDGKFVFSSEIKSIISFLGFKPSIDEIAIDNFLTLQYIPSPATGFKDIYKLPPAHYFIYNNGKLTKHQYWSLKFNKKNNISEDEWSDIIYKELNAAVKSHLVSDVPVGALLSGGLDSSIIVSLMCKNYPNKVNTFSIGFNESKFDESDYAKVVSKKYKTKHRELKVTADDLLSNIERLAYFYDEPIGDNSVLPTYLVSKLAGSYVKVALTGDGGDENFAGYDRYNFVNYAESLSELPKILKTVLSLSSSLLFNIVPSKMTERMNRFLFSLNDKFYKRYVNYNCFFTNKVKHSLYSSHFKNKIGKNNTFNIFNHIYDRDLSDLDNALKMDIDSYLPDDLLYKTDAASMAFGLELRSPFLDHHFMEKMATLPSELKLKKGVKKSILKKMAIKYDLIPEEIINRKKRGFSIPQNIWFKSSLKDFLSKSILSKEMYQIFDEKKLENYLSNYFNSKLNYDNNIFALLMLSLWLRKYTQ